MSKTKAVCIVIVCALSVFLTASPAISGTSTSHLVPEEGLFGYALLNPYFEAVSERLLSYNWRKCQALFLPSFSEESAVYIKYDSDSSAAPPVVVAVRMERQLWFEMHEALDADAGGKGSHSIAPENQRKALLKIQSLVNYSEAPMDRETAEALELTWEAMLMRVRYPETTNLGLDGETCHFANLTKDAGYRTGKVWSPDKGTPPYELVELAKALQEYPGLKESERKTAAQELKKKAQELLDRVKEME